MGSQDSDIRQILRNRLSFVSMGRDGLLGRRSLVNFLVDNPAKLPVAPAERILQIVAIAAVVALLAFAVRVWPELPATVPTHFGFSGEPDRWGSRAWLLVLPAMATLLFVVLTLLERAPQIYNYPIEVSSTNAPRVYVIGRQLVLSLKLIVVVTFAVIFHTSVEVALGNATALPSWFLAAVLGSTAGVILVSLVRISRTRAEARGLVHESARPVTMRHEHS
jgi:uncharacterized membrane protein